MTSDSIKLRKYKIGDKVRGLRCGSKNNNMVGILVDAYVTTNEHFRNPAYVIESPDGIRRSFQGIRLVSNVDK